LLNGHRHKQMLFAFGVGHFFGDNNVLTRVQAGGYRVQPVVELNNQISDDRTPPPQWLMRSSDPLRHTPIINDLWIRRADIDWLSVRQRRMQQSVYAQYMYPTYETRKDATKHDSQPDDTHYSYVLHQRSNANVIMCPSHFIIVVLFLLKIVTL
jgi:hypothetical protein